MGVIVCNSIYASVFIVVYMQNIYQSVRIGSGITSRDRKFLDCKLDGRRRRRDPKYISIYNLYTYICATHSIIYVSM